MMNTSVGTEPSEDWLATFTRKILPNFLSYFLEGGNYVCA